MSRMSWLKVPARIISEGIGFWTDPPKKMVLVVETIVSQRESEGGDKVPRQARTPLSPSMLRPAPHQRVLIYLQANPTESRKEHCLIAIDPETKRLDWGGTTDWLFGREYRGSGALGLAIFTLPVCLVLYPVIFSIATYRRHKEIKDGLSRHARVVLDALRGQLDQATFELLEEAFRNEWRAELTRESSRKKLADK